jgi:hypothetical protein
MGGRLDGETDGAARTGGGRRRGRANSTLSSTLEGRGSDADHVPADGLLLDAFEHAYRILAIREHGQWDEVFPQLSTGRGCYLCEGGRSRRADEEPD